MLIKILLTAGVIYIVYVAFFKPKAIATPKSPQNAPDEADEMIACQSCQIYITKDDSILSLGKYYCSKECVEKAS